MPNMIVDLPRIIHDTNEIFDGDAPMRSRGCIAQA
jgi:glycogen debranching enzyme